MRELYLISAPAFSEVSMNKKTILIAGASAFIPFSTALAQSEPLKLLGFESLPYTGVRDDGALYGPGYEYVASIFKAANVPVTPQGLALSRMVQMLDERPSFAVFLARTPIREDKYVWLSQLSDDKEGFIFISRAGTGVIDSFAQAKTLKRIAAVENGAPAGLLRANGVENIDVAPSEALNLRKLIAGRADAWFSTTSLSRHVTRVERVEQNALIVGPILQKTQFWVLASKQVPSETVVVLRAEFDRARKDSRFAAFRAEIEKEN